ncbi:MAG TPA: Stk1 family PASTA domain-containing Ser/Thr kinase [Solirubrobacterales bacterium]|nr:Stk1 family PASTA domain-containing Ser/Thr kinase [Solirubrobacterales bacterium]
MAEVREGSVVDKRYRVLRRIGSGGMADVWLAEDAHLQRQVALKVLHARYLQDPDFIARFQREAEAAAGLQHPNIVAVFDRGQDDGINYIAMRYVEGPTLKELIDRGLTPEQAVALVRQVLEGARFAHRNGIVHRDLKPQNVILDEEGKAVVTDFGIARAGISDITQTGSVMGTPQYLSPEQAQGFEVTGVSDLYSVGVILYEALTGRVPFEGESAVAVAMKQVSATPQRPSSINPRVSPALDAVVMRALEKEPGNRFQSADAFIAALDQAMKEPGVGAGTAAFAAAPPVVAVPEEVPPVEDRERNWWLWALLVAAIVIGLLVGLALTRDSKTDVPNVTGKQLEFAIAQLERKGFDVGEENFVEREVPRNTVLEQDPLPGAADEDCSFLGFFCSKPSVDLTISAGPGQGEVPGVAGLPAAAATKKLEKAGFDVAVQRINSNSVEEGLVVFSDPRGGATATNGSTVTLFVSQGPKLAKVPVLVGVQREVAVQRLSGRGLTPSVSEEESSSPVGQVIRQSPSAGTEVEPGSTVSLVVSSGEEKKEEEEKETKVPNVIGKERRQAVEAIRAAGLTPQVEEEETEVPSQVGRVTDQFPPPGSELEPGATVMITVGKQAAEVPEEEGELEP